MNTKIKAISLVFLILLIPSLLFAGNIKTGYDLYHYLKLEDKQNRTNLERVNILIAYNYLDGCFNGLILMQEYLFTEMFPRKRFSEKEIYPLKLPPVQGRFQQSAAPPEHFQP